MTDTHEQPGLIRNVRGLSLRGFGKALPEVAPAIRQLAEQIDRMAQAGSEEQVLNAGVRDEIHEIARAARGLATRAENLYPQFLRAHKPDLDRVNAPRGGSIQKERNADAGRQMHDL